MFMSVLIIYHLFHERLTFLQKLHYEIVCANAVGENIAEYRNISKASTLPKQNLLSTKLVRFYLHVHKTLQDRGVRKV